MVIKKASALLSTYNEIDDSDESNLEDDVEDADDDHHDLFGELWGGQVGNSCMPSAHKRHQDQLDEEIRILQEKHVVVCYI